ncbi:MAG: AraC family transcriptional regulator [Bacteroidetes bacterium]|nr:AraC family transcriptional regulator [Bacteroidota bacterium]MCW5894164.1 AraC family transcriptional regulator [Bacteroidota bacterium]
MSLLSILILLGALQGIILFFSILGLKRGNKEANNIAAIFILLISVALLGRYAYTASQPTLFLFKALFVGDLVIFFYGPLLYLYFVKLFGITSYQRISIWAHFLPLFAFVVLILPFMFLDREGFVEQSVRLQNVFYGLELIAICQNYFYLVMNLKLLRSYQKGSYENSSTLPQIAFYKVLLGITFVGVFFWSVSFVLRFLGPEALHSFAGYHLVWISLSVLIIGLGYYILRNPEVFNTFEPQVRAGVKTGGMENVEMLASVLEGVMRERKPYLEPKLTLQELSAMTGISPHLLSRLINERFGKNFFDFVNAFRVDEFKKNATKEKLATMTLFALALESGFNSKTTFNTAFKKLTSQTPREFVQSSTS